MRNLLIRSLTGSLFVLAIAGSLLLHPYVYGLVFLCVVILTLLEFYHLMHLSSIDPQKYLGSFIGVSVFGISYLHANQWVSYRAYYLLLLLFPALYVTELFYQRKAPFHHVAVTVLGIGYVSIPFALMNYLVFQPAYHPEVVLSFFLLIWSFDTGAYLAGISLGRHRLWPSISPKKTWEGIGGGILLSLFAAWIIAKFYVPSEPIRWYVSALIIGAAGTFGDLAESALKRSIGLKDSGNFLPGHGGWLDRFDSALLAMPLFFAWHMLMVGT